MGARAEALAKQFEAKAQEATAAIERLSDTDWKKVTSAEKWSVGVVAHHIAMAHQGIGGIIKTIADHAQEHANCTKAETLALHKKNAAAAAALLRGLGDAELDRSGAVIQGVPAMSAEQIAGGLLCGHMDEHLGSIRTTVGA